METYCNPNELRVELADRTETLTDDSFPFEFSLPLNPGEKALRLHVEAIDATGAAQRSCTTQLVAP